MQLNKINDQITVSGQIELSDLKKIKDLGFNSIINNRPDQEVGVDLRSEMIEAEAKRLNLEYRHIPVFPAQLTVDLIDDIRNALKEMEGPVFAYCRSGTRSCTVWGLSQSGMMESDEILSQASNAGYDLSSISGLL